MLAIVGFHKLNVKLILLYPIAVLILQIMIFALHVHRAISYKIICVLPIQLPSFLIALNTVAAQLALNVNKAIT